MRTPRSGTLVVAFAVVTVALAGGMLSYAIASEWLIALIAPILYAGFFRKRSVYLAMLAIALPITVYVTFVLSAELPGANFKGSMRTTVAAVMVVLMVVESVRRVTQRRSQAERQLRLTQFALDNAPSSVYWLRPDGRLAYVNNSACALLGYTREELLKLHAYDVDRSVQAESWPQEWAEVKKQGSYRFETEHHTKWGETIPVEVSLFHLDYDGDEYVCAFAMDITKRKRAEGALRESEALYRSLVENIDFGATLMDAGHNIRMINRAQAQRIDRSPEACVGKACYELFEGRNTPCQSCPAVTAMRTGNAVESEHTETREDGGLAILRIKTFPLMNAEGEPTGYVELTEDITESRMAEEEQHRLEEQLQYAQKLESLGVLAGGIAHDFNNLLMGILGNAELAKSEIPPASPIVHRLERIEASGHRAADLCHQMLAYSGRGQFVIEPGNLSELVRDSVHLIEVSIAKGVELKLDVANDLPRIEADVSQMRQVIINLAINASEAIGNEPGIVTVRTGWKDCEEDSIRSLYLDRPFPAGRYAYLELTDTGCGIQAEALPKIFDPFFTTKFTGRGLGLAAVLGIVRGHRGGIHIETKAGKGSTFQVFFPAVASRTPAPPRETPEPAAWTGGGTVLLVDDEAAVRDVARPMMESEGFKVISAVDGRQGLDIYRERADEVDLVLLDMSMPNMDGEQTLKEMQRIRSDIRVILSSGYNEREAVDRFADKGLAGFIHKPYQRRELLAKLADVLQGQKLGPAAPSSPADVTDKDRS